MEKMLLCMAWLYNTQNNTIQSGMERVVKSCFIKMSFRMMSMKILVTKVMLVTRLTKMSRRILQKVSVFTQISETMKYRYLQVLLILMLKVLLSRTHLVYGWTTGATSKVLSTTKEMPLRRKVMLGDTRNWLKKSREEQLMFNIFVIV